MHTSISIGIARGQCYWILVTGWLAWYHSNPMYKRNWSNIKTKFVHSISHCSLPTEQEKKPATFIVFWSQNSNCSSEQCNWDSSSFRSISSGSVTSISTAMTSLTPSRHDFTPCDWSVLFLAINGTSVPPSAPSSLAVACDTENSQWALHTFIHKNKTTTLVTQLVYFISSSTSNSSRELNTPDIRVRNHTK